MGPLALALALALRRSPGRPGRVPGVVFAHPLGGGAADNGSCPRTVPLGGAEFRPAGISTRPAGVYVSCDPLASMPSGPCVRIGSLQGVRGASVPIGSSGPFPSVDAACLSASGAAGRCRLCARPHCAGRRSAMPSCNGTACLSGDIAAFCLVTWCGRLAFDACWLLSNAIAPLLHSVVPRVFGLGLLPGFSL